MKSHIGIFGSRPRLARRLSGSGAGFTILEVIVAMGILLFGMTVILGLLTFGAALSRTAQLRTTAANAAESVIADLEETLFPIQNGEAGEPKPIQDRALHGALDLVYSATARPNPDRPDEYRVDVDMSWKSQGVQRDKRFTTLLLREIPFGERLRRQFVEGDTKSFEPASPAKSDSASKSQLPASTPKK